MPKGPQGQKTPPKSKKLPRKLPEDPVSRAVAIMRQATNQEVGDTADKITRAPKTNKKPKPRG
jgi:hypothetical protein